WRRCLHKHLSLRHPVCWPSAWRNWPVQSGNHYRWSTTLQEPGAFSLAILERAQSSAYSRARQVTQESEANVSGQETCRRDKSAVENKRKLPALLLHAPRGQVAVF